MNIKYKIKADVYFRAIEKLETNIYADTPDDAERQFHELLDLCMKQKGFINYDWSWEGLTVKISDEQ